MCTYFQYLCLFSVNLHHSLLRNQTTHNTPAKFGVLTYHAGPGLFSNEGIPEDLGQSAHPERNVIAVHSQ